MNFSLTLFFAIFISCFFGLAAIILIISEIRNYIAKKNYYPRQVFKLDITKRHHMSDSDFLDYYIINCGTQLLEEHISFVKQWEEDQINSVQNLKKRDKVQTRIVNNRFKGFNFISVRVQTRYRQVNYNRHAYKKIVQSNNFYLDYQDVQNRINFLKTHNYSVTYSGYKSENQRKVLTKELKQKIKERDNYTCQICNKYMPDEVGLHIDHIIPISKGGKSTPSNLQVLCSKCNSKKGIK